MRVLSRVLLPALLLSLASCGGSETPDHAEPAKGGAAEMREDLNAPRPVKKGIVPPKTETMVLPEGANPALTDASKATATAPDVYKVKFTTTKGDFVVEVHREWAPGGADRLYNLVQIGFFDQIAMFRAIEGFMVQFGISGYPEVNTAWREAKIPDDPVVKSNTRGMLTFATSGKNSRTTQLFINFVDNSNLDGMGFSPVGEVVEGMNVVDSVFTGYGEGAPRGRGPDQSRIQMQGNVYLKERFPNLDYITGATIVP